MTKSNQKKGLNYIPLLESTYPEMQRKTSLRQNRACPRPPVGRGLEPHARAVHVSPAHGGQGGYSRALEQRACPRPPVVGGLEPRAALLEMQRKHILKYK